MQCDCCGKPGLFNMACIQCVARKSATFPPNMSKDEYIENLAKQYKHDPDEIKRIVAGENN